VRQHVSRRYPDGCVCACVSWQSSRPWLQDRSNMHTCATLDRTRAVTCACDDVLRPTAQCVFPTSRQSWPMRPLFGQSMCLSGLEQHTASSSGTSVPPPAFDASNIEKIQAAPKKDTDESEDSTSKRDSGRVKLGEVKQLKLPGSGEGGMRKIIDKGLHVVAYLPYNIMCSVFRALRLLVTSALPPPALLPPALRPCGCAVLFVSSVLGLQCICATQTLQKRLPTSSTGGAMCVGRACGADATPSCLPTAGWLCVVAVQGNDAALLAGQQVAGV